MPALLIEQPVNVATPLIVPTAAPPVHVSVPPAGLVPIASVTVADTPLVMVVPPFWIATWTLRRERLSGGDGSAGAGDERKRRRRDGEGRAIRRRDERGRGRGQRVARVGHGLRAAG